MSNHCDFYPSPYAILGGSPAIITGFRSASRPTTCISSRDIWPSPSFCPAGQASFHLSNLGLSTF